MAEASTSVDQNQFSCPICLDLLKDPVAIPCGHSYCMGCIKGCWDRDDQTGVYSCPQCRETFTPRPVLNRNTMLAEVVEKLKKTGLQAAPPAHCYAGPGDVVCDICTGRKRKAIKSCLVCLASYCETHLKLHNELDPGATHNVINATGHLQDNICPQHKKLLDVYCRTDQQCICYLCVMDEHGGHDTVSAAAERTEKQSIPAVKEVHPVEPQTREDFLQYYCQLTLDPNTVHSNIRLSEGNREAIYVEEIQSYPDHPERFDYWLQVLCREGLSGHCYWEAEWNMDGSAEIAVAYKEISRKGGGNDSSLGWNNKSWGLSCSIYRSNFWYNNECTKIPVPTSRIGVYLDHRAGILSFYSVSETMTLLHRVQTTFTQPLYPGFGVGLESVKLCDLG